MQPERGILTLKERQWGKFRPTEERAMIGSEKDQEFAERTSAAALDPKTRAEPGAPFILPWRMDANQDHPLRPAKEHDSCSAGECGCGISSDVK
jgi:hypothetical protein